MLFRAGRRQDGLRDLYRKAIRGQKGVEETWITVDEFYKEMDELLFTVSTDLFLPCGEGLRPSTGTTGTGFLTPVETRPSA